jgi:3-hydroxy-9,10-secoandrosta-1,3,5(10)-triene-9,17-dione monooxygenase reductase component
MDLAFPAADPDRPRGARHPVLVGTAVRLGCELHSHYQCGDHHIVIGAIHSADATADLHPLLQHNGV